MRPCAAVLAVALAGCGVAAPAVAPALSASPPATNAPAPNTVAENLPAATTSPPLLSQTPSTAPTMVFAQRTFVQLSVSPLAFTGASGVAVFGPAVFVAHDKGGLHRLGYDSKTTLWHLAQDEPSGFADLEGVCTLNGTHGLAVAERTGAVFAFVADSTAPPTLRTTLPQPTVTSLSQKDRPKANKGWEGIACKAMDDGATRLYVAHEDRPKGFLATVVDARGRLTQTRFLTLPSEVDVLLDDVSDIAIRPPRSVSLTAEPLAEEPTPSVAADAWQTLSNVVLLLSDKSETVVAAQLGETLRPLWWAKLPMPEGSKPEGIAVLDDHSFYVVTDKTGMLYHFALKSEPAVPVSPPAPVVPLPATPPGTR